MKKFKDLEKFGFKLKQPSKIKMDSQVDVGPIASLNTVMNTGPPKMDAEVTEDLKMEFPYFLLKGKPCIALHGLQLEVLQSFMEVPRLIDFNDEQWRFILCKIASTDPDLQFSIDCQLQFQLIEPDTINFFESPNRSASGTPTESPPASVLDTPKTGP